MVSNLQYCFLKHTLTITIYYRSQIFAALFATLSGSLVSLFPSQRMQNNAGVPRSDIDQEDASIWQFLAALAVSASATEQQSLISELREKILSEVSAARLPTCPSEVSSMKLVSCYITLINCYCKINMTTFVSSKGKCELPFTKSWIRRIPYNMILISHFTQVNNLYFINRINLKYFFYYYFIIWNLL